MSFISIGAVTINYRLLGIDEDIETDMQLRLYHPGRAEGEPEVEILMSIERKEDYEKIFYHVQDTLIECEVSEEEDEIQFKRFPIIISYTGEESLTPQRSNDDEGDLEVLV